VRAGIGLALLSVASVACFGPFRIGDGYLGAEGHVYEAAHLRHGGRAAVLIDSSESMVAASYPPVADCAVVLEPWSPRKRPRPDTAELWTRRTTTDAVGYFATGGTAAPGRYEATISVTCPGFQPQVHVFTHDRLRHQVLAFMMRESSSGPQNNELQRTKPADAMELRR
jgi:hypothetical protein